MGGRDYRGDRPHQSQRKHIICHEPALPPGWPVASSKRESILLRGMSHLETLEKPDAPERPPSTSIRSAGWRWQWLMAPLMGISILLHIALLFVPLPSFTPPAEEVAAEAAPEEEEDAAIDILALSDIAAPEPPPEPLVEAPPPSAAQAPPPPPEAVPPPPEPQTVPAASPEPVVAAPPPIATGMESAAPSFDPAAATNQFIGDIAGLGVEDYTSELGLPPPDHLRNPGNAACFLQPGGGTAPGVRVANWLDKEPQTLLRENLQDVYGPRGITFEELPPFCGERYFRGITAEEQPFMTFSLVTLAGSTLLVVWETPPQ